MRLPSRSGPLDGPDQGRRAPTGDCGQPYREVGGGTYGRGRSSTESHRTIAGIPRAV